MTHSEWRGLVRIGYRGCGEWLGVGQWWRLRVVDMPGGGDPGGAAVGVLGDRPAGDLFDLMVMSASRTEVEFAGRSRAVCWVVGNAVVEVAAVAGTRQPGNWQV